ncbi:MAG TPA: hypothetical protein VMO47_08780 [Rhodothermales bacterium]|nr:hypothetical protein [Rhodothermales bacterium]
MDVRFEYDSQKRLGLLKWKPNSTGRRPLVYRVYASDEKGFSVSDTPYKLTTGASRELPDVLPANFLIETSSTALAVVGPGVTLAGANKAYYRVVAVDAAGNRSGPSDYAKAPRPVIFSQPVVDATRGEEYRYDVSAIRSIGDLRMRQVDGREVANYWNIERPRFRIEQGPRWLEVDETTGLLSGVPDAPGTSEVIVSVTLEREMRQLDEETLKWGNEKIIASGKETVGTDSQEFVLEVGP